MKNLVLGAFSNYNWNQLQYWVNSLKMTGYDGDIVVIVGNASFETVEKLLSNGIKVVAFDRDDANKMYTYRSNLPIQTERFFHFWNFLKDHWDEYNNVIITDMKDVIFQKNPFEFSELGYAELIVGSECLKYQDEPWGRENLQQGFGTYFYETFKDRPIYNVGVIAGYSEYIKDFCLAIFQMSINRPIPIVEQAAMNALLFMLPYEVTVWQMNMEEGFVVHLGTVMDPSKIEQFRPFLLEDEPVVDFHPNLNPNKPLVMTKDLKPFHIVHQYDRVPDLRAQIEKYYGDEPN